MKLKDLVESPQLVNQELDKKFEVRGVFASDDTLVAEYENLLTDHDSSLGDIESYIKKSKSSAIIGLREVRESDQKSGLRPYTLVEFKKSLNLNGIKHIPGAKDELQVSIVTTTEQNRRLGFGMLLYLSLANAGYTVISDNTQYIGGKELWKSLARKTVSSKYKVFVLEDGELLMKDEKPIIYDGSNIDDSLLWSANVDKKYVLFALIVL